MLRALTISIALLLAPNAVLAQFQQEYGDTEFDFDNDWSLYGPYVLPPDAPNGDFTVEQVLTDGMPGANLQVIMTRPTVPLGDSAEVWGAVINDTLVWNPSEQGDGLLGRLEFRIDARDGGAWTLAVKQDGYVWLALTRRKFGELDSWVSLSIECMKEVDFVPLRGSEFVVENQPEHPDFSTAGSPIAFGIGAGLSCPTRSDCTQVVPVEFRLDNLGVTARQPLVINAGLNDAWFEPATAGQGIFHILFPEIELVFLSWFTYDVERPSEATDALLGEPGHRWLTAQGGYAGDTEVLDIYLTQGGVFDSDDPTPAPPVSIGTMTIEWCSCERGRLTYDMQDPDLAGTVELERITPDNVALCQALQ